MPKIFLESILYCSLRLFNTLLTNNVRKFPYVICMRLRAFA